MSLELTDAEVQFVNDNLQDKTIFRIARELSEQRGLSRKDRIRRRDLIKYFEEKFQRNLRKEKFGR